MTMSITASKSRKLYGRVCTQLHFGVCRRAGVKVEKNEWYGHITKPAETCQDNEVTTLWDRQTEPYQATNSSPFKMEKEHVY
jgi:hypothetical protein